MTVQDWLRAAVADATQRGLPQLAPLLETLAKSTTALRETEAALRAAARHSGDGPAQDGSRP